MDPPELVSSDAYKKLCQEQRLVEFMMALKIYLEAVHGSTIHRNTLPCLSSAVSELLAKETCLKFLTENSQSGLSKSISSQVFTTGNNSNYKWLNPNNGMSNKSRAFQDECAYCHKMGHWKKDCPQLQSKHFQGGQTHRMQVNKPQPLAAVTSLVMPNA